MLERMRELYIIDNIFKGKTCLSLFNIPIVLMILLAILFIWLSQFKWICMVIPKILKSFTHSIFVPPISNTGNSIFFRHVKFHNFFQ